MLTKWHNIYVGTMFAYSKIEPKRKDKNIMNVEKLTVKSQVVIAKSQTLASNNNNQFVEPIHILKTMLEEENSIIPYLLKKYNPQFSDHLK